MNKYIVEFDFVYDYKNDEYFKNYPNVEKEDMITWFLGGDIYLVVKDVSNSKNGCRVTFSRIEPFLGIFEDLIEAVMNILQEEEKTITLEDNSHTIRLKSLNETEVTMVVRYFGITDFFPTLKKEYKNIKIDKIAHATFETQEIIVKKTQLFEEIFKKTDAFLNHLKQVNPKLLELDWVKRIIEKRKNAQKEFEKYLKILK